MRKLLITSIIALTASASAYAVIPHFTGGADNNSIAVHDGTSEKIKFNDDGTITAVDPTAAQHVATKAYVDANTGASSGIQCQKTPTSYNGNLGGPSGAKAKCVAAFGSEWYWGTLQNMQQDGDISSLTGAYYLTSTCGTFTSSSSGSTAFYTSTATGFFSSGTCNQSRPVLCCKN